MNFIEFFGTFSSEKSAVVILDEPIKMEISMVMDPRDKRVGHSSEDCPVSITSCR